MASENVNSKEPLYLQVYYGLKSGIKEGVYNEGDLLPPEPELQKMYNVSRATIRKAVEMLAQEGYVEAKQGKGTLVTDPKTVQKLNFVTSFTETLIEKGYVVSTRGIQIDLIHPPQNIAAMLKVDRDQNVYRIQRVKLANDKPIAIMINYLLPVIVPNLKQKVNKINSLYALLETEYNVKIESATEFIGAESAGYTEADMLEVTVGTPLLVSRRITYSNSRPIEVAISSIVGGKYEYCVQLNGRPH